MFLRLQSIRTIFVSPVVKQLFEQVNQLRNLVNLNSLFALKSVAAPFVVVLNQQFVLADFLVNLFNCLDLDFEGWAEFVDGEQKVHALLDDLGLVFLLLG